MVDLADPLKFTTELGLKLTPNTVNVKPALPAVTDKGETELVTGTVLGLPTMNTCAPEVPPPGAGLVTVTLNEPIVLRSEARIPAVN